MLKYYVIEQYEKITGLEDYIQNDKLHSYTQEKKGGVYN